MAGAAGVHFGARSGPPWRRHVRTCKEVHVLPGIPPPLSPLACFGPIPNFPKGGAGPRGPSRAGYAVRAGPGSCDAATPAEQKPRVVPSAKVGAAAPKVPATFLWRVDTPKDSLPGNALAAPTYFAPGPRLRAPAPPQTRTWFPMEVPQGEPLFQLLELLTLPLEEPLGFLELPLQCVHLRLELRDLRHDRWHHCVLRWCLWGLCSSCVEGSAVLSFLQAGVVSLEQGRNVNGNVLGLPRCFHVFRVRRTRCAARGW